MLTALLPGIREFRTPLATGVLWVAVAWFIFGSEVAGSVAVAELVSKFNLDQLPTPAWYAAAVLGTFLLGSLLVIEDDPHKLPSQWVRFRVADFVDRFEPDLSPGAGDGSRRSRFVWWLWHSKTFGSFYRIRNEVRERRWNDSALVVWVSNFYDDMAGRGRVPVMRIYPSHCDSPTGFKDFYDPATISSDNTELHEELKDHLLDQVRRERVEVEVRVQMEFPEVYSEIDRLREEARLRVSIYWPLLALSAVLCSHGVWLALAGFPVAGLLLMRGKRSARESIEKTWAPLIAGKVTSPTLDVMKER